MDKIRGQIEALNKCINGGANEHLVGLLTPVRDTMEAMLKVVEAAEPVVKAYMGYAEDIEPLVKAIANLKGEGE